MHRSRRLLWLCALPAVLAADLGTARLLGPCNPHAALWRQNLNDFAYALGQGLTVALVAGALGALAWVLQDRRLASGARWLLGSMLLSAFWCQMFKHLIGRPRPMRFLDSGWVLPLGPTFRPSFDSLPSGHVTTMFAAVPLLVALFPRAGRVWIILAWVVAAGRVLGTAHYLSDVLIAAALGWQLGLYARGRWSAEVADAAE